MAKIDQYKKVKNTNLIFSGIIAVLVIAIVVLLLLPDKQQQIYSAYAKQDGNTLPTDHVLKQVTVKKLVDLSDGDDIIFVYFGTDTCTNCAAVVGQIDETLRAAGVDTIYYLKSNASFKLSESNTSYLTENIEGDFTPDGTPQVWAIQSGRIILNSDNFTDADDNIKWSYFLSRCTALLETSEE